MTNRTFKKEDAFIVDRNHDYQIIGAWRYFRLFSTFLLFFLRALPPPLVHQQPPAGLFLAAWTSPTFHRSFESPKPVGSRWRLRFLDRGLPPIFSVCLSSLRFLSFLSISSSVIYRHIRQPRIPGVEDSMSYVKSLLRSRVNKHRRACLLSRPTTSAGCHSRSPRLDQGPSRPQQV